jgi:probable HAF family extracellular repeat protein
VYYVRAPNQGEEESMTIESMRVRGLSFVMGLAVVVCGARLAEARSIRDLGTLGGANSIARAINQSGQIVGEAETAAGLTHAFIFTPWVGRMQDLGTLGGRFSFAGGLNSRGQVVGASTTVADDASGGVHAVIWDQGRIRALPPSPSAFQSDNALAINDNGVIVGGSNDGPVIWQNGTVRHLFATGNGFASGINNSNVIVGNVSDTGNFHGFIIRNGVATNLDNVVGPQSSADAVTDSGNVVGGYFPVGSERPHGFLYNYFSGRVIDLGVFQGGFSLAHGVSPSGLVAGDGGNQSTQAVFWDNNHVLRALGFLPGGTFSSAFGINDGGTAVGLSGTAQFNNHAVAWLP